MVILNSTHNEILTSIKGTSAANPRKHFGLRLTGLLQLRGGHNPCATDKECTCLRDGKNDECSNTSGAEISIKRTGIFSGHLRKRPLQSVAPAPFVGVPVAARRNKQVSFAAKQATIVATVSFPKELKSDLFYSKEELMRMSSRAQRMGEDVAGNKDKKHIASCLNYCYGFSTQQTGLTQDQALYCYIHYEATEGTTKTTVRGLERHISPRIVQCRQDCVQSVLSVQAKMRANGGPSAADLEEELARQSRHHSEKARRFAQLLGKGDVVVSEDSPTEECFELFL